jgi:hypothetical protein
MEIACPSKTIVKPRIPDGRLDVFCVDIILMEDNNACIYLID